MIDKNIEQLDFEIENLKKQNYGYNNFSLSIEKLELQLKKWQELKEYLERKQQDIEETQNPTSFERNVDDLFNELLGGNTNE